MRYLLAATSLLLLHASLARAGHPPIVLESYTGEKPADAAKILSPVFDELATKKFVVGADVVGRQFEAIASRPALTGGLPKDFAAAVDAGYDQWTNGKFDEAAKRLAALVEAARDNPGAFALDEKLAPHLEKALIALSLSQLKLGDRSAAKQAMAEALRGNPDFKITRAMYGQDALDLYNEVAAELKAAGEGKLIVSVNADAAGIFVNERLRRMNDLELRVLPGEYRVVARIGQELSRAHRIVVKGGDIQKVTIEPAFDRAVHSAPSWAGFRFETTAERERSEASHGAAFAEAIDAEQVAVVGIDVVRGQRVVSGALINKRSGHEFRRAIIPLDGNPSAEQLRGLARFLVSGGPLPPGVIEPPPTEPRDREPGERGGGGGGARMWGGWKLITGGAAVAAGVAGGLLLAYDGACPVHLDPGVPCPNPYRNAVQGWIAVGGAAVLAGVTVYLVVKEHRAGDGAGGARRTAYLAPTAGGAIAGYAARF
ncbi:MAG TPA: hypothetical protein VN253_15930 [Kofleriaceae bacterium]|nr:hypothetical protein [Kofleriaceae bacterium]